jgi:hypothetical protein
MLGLGRASQYAGWWGGGPLVVSITADAELASAVYQTPAYSFLYNASDRAWSINNSGTYDLTGYSSLSGFNNLRYTTVQTVYLPWPSGLSDGYYGSPINVSLKQSGQTDLSLNGVLDIVSGSLKISYGYANNQPSVTLPGAYTNYTNRWLTFVNCGAETSSVYTNYAPTGTGTNYLRLAVYDTETGELLGKTDRQDSSSRRSISAYGTSVSAQSGATNCVAINGFSGGGEQIRQSNLWYSFGTMFDPETETSGSWRTTRIPETVGTGSAWLSQSFTTYAIDSTPDDYYADSATGIYSVASDFNLKFADSTSAFTTGYSTTIIPKDRS